MTQTEIEHITSTGKERDAETGFSYYGARYYDPELSALFLSVDPRADKYPGISPYAYCAWNPVKLVDPDGREVSKNDDWYKNAQGEVLWNEDVHSQADLKNNEVYLGATTLMTKEGDDNTMFGDVNGKKTSSVPLPSITISSTRSTISNKKCPIDEISMGTNLPITALENTLEKGSKASKIITKGTALLNFVLVLPDAYAFAKNPNPCTGKQLTISTIETTSNLLNFVIPGLGSMISIIITSIDISGGFDDWYKK